MPAAVRDEAVGGDEELLARIAAGSQAALSALMARHGRGLRTFATRYLGHAADAEDVVQEVFVTVWKQAARFDPGRARASTWLYRITANRCIDQRRRRALRNFFGLDDVAEEPAALEANAETATAARQELAIVRDGLSRLPERQRMALLLRAVGELDIGAIAEVMGASAGSVEQLLVRGRRALRDHLADAAAGRERKSS
ncbi:MULTISPECIES: sigma-70 family RNA polymerase sigma factor [unclassified Mesorhizobium]|uniref:RNA polymerase sigma factor n=2 Tax=Mesorhizobium TaxID=68287 RepID=UPI000F762F29|nr:MULTISPECIES: sigma-70 family RNA polymerase sigma factor [unclassified Mesorhizobium]RUW79774.1 sigma-70 family RNA polymerase sigma factor [Mesorhizobium sp. M2A.F.Ca.ET.067.02.1.1]RVC91947.1 sigma-70 family RNA polymerase sigma factor [Mesorhizobium sp. M2A.F.Ca.ET.017.03.2.1]RWB41049.1 MAG: sigma-70 family RNA polymerase sigma factor [Mesorhizobium sp.]AZO06569.1 sigma-70 family RNA polymerase sigma factor [Mesorhizobium sp. M2A.F.Ca.ET.043.02.1.1]RUW40680.1 sigma-70 family RNA polymera